MKYHSVYTDRLDIESAILLDEKRIKEIVGWLNNPCTMQYSEQRHLRHTVETQRDYLSSFHGDDTLLTINHNHVMIGTISVTVDTPNKIANVGILIGCREHWGRGFGFEAWKAVCDMKFNDGIRKIEAGCAAYNTSMMSICSRYDMIEEGRQIDHFLMAHGSPVDLVHWGKFK